MKEFKEYKQVFDSNNGVISTGEFINAGFHHSHLKELIKNGFIRKIKRGYYEWYENEIVSDIAIIKKLYPDAVIYLNSALYLYGYLDRTPSEWSIAVSRYSSRSRFAISWPKIKPFYLQEKFMELGVSKIIYENHEVPIFDRDRSVCDLVRNINKLDKEIVNSAIKSYIKDSKKNITNLLSYAEKMRAKAKLNEMIGMWL